MSFDMSQCKIGDNLICRNGVVATYLGDNSSAIFPHKVKVESYKGLTDFSVCVTARGSMPDGRGFSGYDIVGFYKEEGKMIERDKEYDLKVTGEQLAILLLLTGSTNTCRSKGDLYFKIDRMFSNNPNNESYDGSWFTNLYGNSEKIDTWLNDLFKEPETQEQKNLRELKEQYKLLGDKINQLEGK